MYNRDPLAYVATQLLISAIPQYFPNVNVDIVPELRFRVRTANDDSPHYYIEDLDIAQFQGIG